MADKLELVWPGKDSGMALVRDEQTGDPRQIPYAEVQPRLLIEQGCYGDPGAGNLLIQGENLYALKTLLASGYAGQVKLVYIDPPYNTGKIFAEYDDGLERSLWLTIMRDRLTLLRDLLAPDGSIWVQLDDDEAQYCKVLMDEIFGKNNFVATVVWQKKYSPQNDATYFSDMHDYVLVYARTKKATKNDPIGWSRNLMPRTDRQNSRYKKRNPDDAEAWKPSDLSVKTYSEEYDYPIELPSGRIVNPPRGRSWSMPQREFEKKRAANLIWFGVDGDSMPSFKRGISTVQQGIVPTTWWPREECGDNEEAKKEIKSLFNDEGLQVFSTPKPERLMQRIIQIATNPGDLVLDCYLGSGTTAAVAHKLDRQWIGIEAGAHAEQLCLTRLKKVVDGSDQGGISRDVPPHPSKANGDTNLLGETVEKGWTGGGGFRYYTLGQALLERDAVSGVWRLNYDNGKLIEAVCLHEGFKLLGDGVRHGIKGRHYAHVADHSQIAGQSLIEALAEVLEEGETMTLYCTRHAANLKLPANVEIKRIPQTLIKERL